MLQNADSGTLFLDIREGGSAIRKTFVNTILISSNISWHFAVCYRGSKIYQLVFVSYILPKENVMATQETIAQPIGLLPYSSLKSPVQSWKLWFPLVLGSGVWSPWALVPRVSYPGGLLACSVRPCDTRRISYGGMWLSCCIVKSVNASEKRPVPKQVLSGPREGIISRGCWEEVRDRDPDCSHSCLRVLSVGWTPCT